MKRGLFFLLIFGVVFNFGLLAQVNPGHSSMLRDYENAKTYFDKGHLDLAYKHFKRLREMPDNDFLLPDIDYYLTVIEVSKNRPYADKKITDYLLRYPLSPYRDRIRVLAIDKRFREGKYKTVKRMIDETEVYNLPANERERMNFYLAYIYLKDNDLKRSKRLFKSLEKSKNYKNQAKYYLGYIAYLKNNPVEAQRYFSQVQNEKKYRKNIPYYNADMYYKSGLFEKAIEEALKIYPKTRGRDKSQLAKIIGSSYFNLKQYDKAIPYLELYRGNKGKKTNKDFYELGYAYYQAEKCDRAIDYFNKIIGSDNELAQNAYYHLAKCYLKKGDKTQALNAFKRVAEMNYNPQVKEDAWYQYIKLSYEIGNPYESLNDIVTGYLAEYPASPHRNELKELLISSYLTSRNYEEALKAMRQNRMTGRPEFQKVAFMRGLEMFNEGKYEEAIKLFDLSLRKGLDPVYRNKAVFWKAEALYRLNRFEEALTEFKSLDGKEDFPFFEKKLLDYNLGYTYFKLKNYPQAARHFQRFINENPDKNLLKDAYLRLGDSYFASKKYWPAMDAYNKAIQMKGHNSDYAFYQKAISYGFVGKTGRKIEELKKFLQKYPQSKLTDNALYQLASTYLNLGKYRESVSYFDRLINQFPKSPYVAVSMLKKGLAFYNADENNRAKQTFEALIRKFPKTPEAVEASGYLKNIYIDENNPDGFLSFINQIPGFNVESNQLEQEIFNAAESKYFENKLEQARAAFSSYLKRFPEGVYKTEALHYLAKIYMKLQENDRAYQYYEKLANMPAHEFSIEALRYLAMEDLKNNKPEKAVQWLEKLKSWAKTDDDLLFATANLMKIYKQQNKNDLAVSNAQSVLSNPKHDKVMSMEAKRILAEDAVRKNNWTRAEELYDDLAQNATGEAAAEALYYKAYILHRKGNYDQSNKVVSQLSKKYPGYKKWGGKALIVMAKNMYAKDDVFNATYILENVIKRFDKYPEIVREAQETLKTIKQEQSRKNEDIQNELE